ncbi:TetR/AcrR family transcriptional regulator [Actinoplanes sp. NPDC051411]|uniref:TetR/AcrR family transcriptional regulator n=1 Tax=Actinoplanes sp. NPDC051411 TaxID=3155522 RepID=UPI00342A5269
MTGNDRRVRRTRRALRDALVGLIVERGYEKVTVQDVLDRADIGRSTFYAHYRDKDALFEACFDDLRAELERELAATVEGPSHDDPTRPVGVVFEHAYANQRVYQALCGRSGATSGTRMLHRLILDSLRDHLTPVGLKLPVDMVAEYHAGALVAVLIWWVRQGFPQPPGEIAQMCQKMITPGVMATF